MFVGLAVGIVIAAIVLASLHLRGVRGLRGNATQAFVERLRRVPVGERLGMVKARARQGTFEAKVADALEAAPNATERVVAANEALGDLAFELESRARWSPAAVRLILFGCFLCVAIALIHGSLFELCGAAVLGAVGFVVCVSVRNRARTLDQQLRTTADALVDALVPDTPRTRGVGKRFG